MKKAIVSRLVPSVGTRTLIMGYHQVLIHPVLVMVAWTKLYGFTFDVRIWIAALVHDLGYAGKKDTDGESGNAHPRLGGRIMDILFGKDWGDFARGHSAGYCADNGLEMSRLYVADKLAGALLPVKWHVVLLTLSGEIGECKQAMGISDATIQARMYRARTLRKVAACRRTGFSGLAPVPA